MASLNRTATIASHVRPPPAHAEVGACGSCNTPRRRGAACSSAMSQEQSAAATGSTPTAGVMLVTGASSGVGAHLVRHFAAKSWHVAAVARSAAKLEELCKPFPGHAFPFPCDQCDRAAVLAMVSSVQSTVGHVDVLVLNAAQAHDGKPFWELSIDDVDRVLDVNLKGTMYVVHPVLKDMVQRNAGRIIGVASVAGTRGIANESCYVASKHGMVGFLDTIADETRNTDVCVTTLCPGGIDTPWWRPDHPYGSDSSHEAGTTSHLIQTQEIVDFVEYQLAQPTNRVWKRVIMFPKTEWH
mmetsp:Transcript_19012/g.36611  ORF Transcript_19012/g.36611 Transcript_19012/m.36611 type:complete len:298 (-) Transcript_19012:76-969(-)